MGRPISEAQAPLVQVGAPPSRLQKARQVPAAPPAAGTTHCPPRAQKAAVPHAAPAATVPLGTQMGSVNPGNTEQAWFVVQGDWSKGLQG